jgi:signal transduction histidine kinase
MFGRRPWSLRWWVGALVVGVALPLVLLLAWLYDSRVRQEKTEARDLALRLAKATAGRLLLLHQESTALLQRMASRPAIRDFDGKNCDSLFSIVDFFPQYADLILFDASGRAVCAATPDLKDRDASLKTREWVGEALRQGRLRPGMPVIRPIDHRWVAVLSVAVTRGTLVLLELPEVVAGEGLAPGAVMTVLDRDGSIVARSSESVKWSGQNVRSAGIARIAMQGKEGAAAAVGVDGIDRQYGFTEVPGAGWFVYVGLPTSEVMRPIRRMFVRGILAGAAMVLMLALAATLLSRAMRRPIAALARAAQSVAGGAYDTVEVSGGPAELVTLAGAFNDMVERRSAAEQAMQEGERRLKALSDRLLVIQEKERSRIARELHDDLGQSLTALKMDVIGLLQQTGTVADGSAISARILSTIDATVTSVQRISSELRPSALDDLGLVEAIEAEALLFLARSSIECELSLPEAAHVDPIRATAIYRIVQEALTNVARHSGATRVEIRLRERAEELLLEIRDDGCGVTPEQVHDPASLGLLGIRERADLVGGTAHFEGVAGRGTIVSVRIPRQPE